MTPAVRGVRHRASAQEIAASAQSLAGTASELDALVQRFKMAV
jgi:methyl-accepting chemotaxis protein